MPTGFTLTSLRSAVKAKLHINSPYVDAAISEALRFYRSEEVWFNVSTYKFTTETDLFSYPLPADFLGLRGDVYCTPSGSDEDSSRYALRPRTADEIEQFRFGLTEWDSTTFIGVPKIYAMDFNGKSMLLAPVTEAGGDIIFFKYTADYGTPDYTVSVTSSVAPSLQTTVTMVDSGGTSVATTFMSPWIENAFDLILHRAVFCLLTDYHISDSNMQRAEVYRLKAEDELRRIKGENAQLAKPPRIRRWW